jgi:hypothetical protein
MPCNKVYNPFKNLLEMRRYHHPCFTHGQPQGPVDRKGSLSDRAACCARRILYRPCGLWGFGTIQAVIHIFTWLPFQLCKCHLLVSAHGKSVTLWSPVSLFLSLPFITGSHKVPCDGRVQFRAPGAVWPSWQEPVVSQFGWTTCFQGPQTAPWPTVFSRLSLGCRSLD